MKLNLFEKIIIAFISIILVTRVIILMFLEKNEKAILILNRKVENFTTEYNNKQETEEDDYSYEPFIKQEGFTPIIEGLDIGRSIRDAFTKPFKPLIDFFNKLKDAFKSFPGRIKAFGDAFKFFGEGIRLEFINLGKSLKTGFEDIFDVVGTLGKCSIKTLTNFRYCIMWYICDWIGHTLYAIIIELPVFMIKYIFNIDLQEQVNNCHCLLEECDKMIFQCTGFHIIHYPGWVIEKCYSCDYQKKINKINLDFTKTIPAWLNEPTQKFIKAKDSFKKTFT
jgi:hypothetical protein